MLPCEWLSVGSSLGLGGSAIKPTSLKRKGNANCCLNRTQNIHNLYSWLSICMSLMHVINGSGLMLSGSFMLKHPWEDAHLIYHYLSATPAHLHTLPANKPSRFSLHVHASPHEMLTLTHIHTHIYPPQPTRPHNLKGDIGNKFDTSAYPRSALRTKRNLILDKPPDKISALALCC